MFKNIGFKRIGQEKNTTFTVEDGLGNSIDLPKYGCLTPSEEVSISEAWIKHGNAVSFSKMKLIQAAEFLKHRLKIEINEAALSEQASSFQMIEAIYDFSEGERRRWAEPSLLLECSGNGAEFAAIQTAKEYNGVVVSRDDLKIKKIFLVFSTLADIPKNYFVCHDFTDTKIEDVPKKKESK